uniref:Uncharacterized protein isoform X1 n=1 Tax=Nicotiana tabacum TaxID=4097 RepID=A0A1S3XE65_TOBAC|nr:PREDICTED: uncharacterized protein LOC107764139 isoform X1 [Nicotiana tabacum]XP_016438163.1 PREDICTED: uncharacterized protein LOC107764139 isoform X1 [Nicotiana tabacum]
MTLGDKPMAQFLREAKAIADELTAAGTPVSLDEFNATIFRLLPSYYHPVIAMLFEEKSQVSFSDLSGRLMDHEILLQNSRILISVVANISRQHTSSARQFHQSSQENNGYRNNGASSKGNMKWFPNPCQICGLNNHQAK